MEQGGPEMVSLWLPPDLWWTMRKPIRECHVAVCQVKRIVLSSFGSYRVLLGEDKAHDFCEFDVIEEEVYVDRVGREFCRSIRLVVDEVVFGAHFHV